MKNKNNRVKKEEIDRGIDSSKFSKGSFAQCDIAVVGEGYWLKKRWEFLEKYHTFPETFRERADICFPVILKILEFQGKTEPVPVDLSTLAKIFENRFGKIEIDRALNILADLMFIKYDIGNLTKEIVTTGLIRLTAEIPEEMKTL